ncbi:alpha-1,4-glucan--maltose-1-phosphate maltosyltransferase [Aeromicrobium sp. A1-2]|uniref:maltotransferase domain-containing protein n=1 Tax=Aeromicrobium sp. A1-2 TaxID=2107713 RepID=UPI000E548A01|nr:maltotransferase domain-containing protein [Aeromicrobium sp. A1-2]AXT85525.1 alpha-1,4-glucan--maltose-1-phosphate maltosyltransferase [Aeromicrobium sp. A1-2]
MTDRLGIDDVRPRSGDGTYPSKAVTGEHVPVTATVWREGHDAVSATVVWRGPGERRDRTTPMAEQGVDSDLFGATIVPEAVGLWTYRVEAWSDPWATAVHSIEVKLAAGQGGDELGNDLELAARLLDEVAGRKERHKQYAALSGAATALRTVALPLGARTGPALSDDVRSIMTDHPVRRLVTRGPKRTIWVDRVRAAYGSWYEFFPRSTGGVDQKGKRVHGTFKTATRELDRVARMGFDVVYLPPIHPIGRVNRKGPNNSLTPGPADPGSPWAIGAKEGGHDAIHPTLGTDKDFAAFVRRAGDLGMEIALDLALQVAPDHPWVALHPEFFTTLPDGTIAFAENPPKKYQDIYPLNFDNDRDAIYAEMLRVTLHWVERGVKIFRVDNPHTKPPDFWAWLISSVKAAHPDVLFLAEAFTRPARLWGLARLGFTQSYTYFTWRTAKEELTEFGEDLRDHWDEGRPNLFVNTPDILPEHLQVGGPGMFALRAALAATLAPTWGVYAGYELYEHQAVKPGGEEYLDSEKYELRPRDHAAALAEGRSLEPWLTRLNQIRREHPALQQMRTLHFHHIDHDALIAYSKQDPATGDTVVIVVSLDPHEVREGTLWLDLPALGFSPGEHLVAHDEVTGETYDWGDGNYVRLDPTRASAHIISLQRHE